LRPHRPARWIKQSQGFVRNPEIAKTELQQSVKSTYGHRKYEEIEEHIKTIKPKILSEYRLFLAPGKRDLQEPNDE